MAALDGNRLTTAAGAPVPNNQNSQTAGAGGPVLLQDHHLLEKLAHFNRERIPERVVHAVGIGAGGHFEVTQDVTKYTKAGFCPRSARRPRSSSASPPLPVRRVRRTPLVTHAASR